MILLLDAGNTRLKWAVVDGENRAVASERVIVDQGSIDYHDGRANDDRLRSALHEIAAKFVFFEVWVSSVAGEQREAALAQLCTVLFGLPPTYVHVTAEACGITNHYHSIENLGVDRWVAAMGLYASLGVNRVIVDAGTAVTVDLVSSENVFMGGAILPGSRLMHDSLVGQTAGIKSDRQNVLTAIGRDTNECVNVGAKYGLAGAIDRVIGEFVATINNNRPWQIVMCGGDGLWLKNLVKTTLPISYEPNLIFDGLLNLRQFNR